MAARACARIGWGLARVAPHRSRWRLGWELLARERHRHAVQLPALSAVLERIWTDAVSGDLAPQHGASRSIGPSSAS